MLIFMGTRLFIKEGGDSRLPNEPRGFYLQLRAQESRPLDLYLAFARKEEKGYRIFEREADSFPKLISDKHYELREALEIAFEKVREKAIKAQENFQIPIMYQDSDPGEGKVIRNLESFTPEVTI